MIFLLTFKVAHKHFTFISSYTSQIGAHYMNVKFYSLLIYVMSRTFISLYSSQIQFVCHYNVSDIMQRKKILLHYRLFYGN